MRVIIDRFEEELAVAELPDGSMLNVPRALFDGAKEGDAVEITVLGKPCEQPDAQSQSPAQIFKKLRKKSGKTRIGNKKSNA